MTSSDDKKPDKAPDFSGMPDIPVGARNWLAGILSQAQNSVLWTLSPVVGDSIARGLAERGMIAVRVNAGQGETAGTPVVYPGTLARRERPDGSCEYELRLDESPETDARPYALCVVPLDVWAFEPVTLGRLPEPIATPAEPEYELSGAEVGALAAAGIEAGPLAADGAKSATLAASNERLDLCWKDRRLEIRLARSPRRGGQPVVVETHVLDAWGDLLSEREVVSVDERITEGEFAGYVRTSIVLHAPAQADVDHLRITVRPLRADDLAWLRPEQVDPLLAGQKLIVLKTLSEGLPLRASAAWGDQLTATSDPQATWLLRVATGKGVR